MPDPLTVKVNDLDSLSERQQFVVNMERLYGPVKVVDDYGDIVVLSQRENIDHGQ